MDMYRNLLLNVVIASLLIGPLPVYSDNNGDGPTPPTGQVYPEPQVAASGFDPQTPIIFQNKFTGQADQGETLGDGMGAFANAADGEVIEGVALTDEAGPKLSEFAKETIHRWHEAAPRARITVINNSELPQDAKLASEISSGERVAQIVEGAVNGAKNLTKGAWKNTKEFLSFRTDANNRRLSIYRFGGVGTTASIALVLGGVRNWPQVAVALFRGFGIYGPMSGTIQYYSDYLPWNKYKLPLITKLPMWYTVEILYFYSDLAIESAINHLALALHMNAPFLLADQHAIWFTAGWALFQGFYEFAGAKRYHDIVENNPGDSEAEVTAKKHRNITSAFASAEFVSLGALRNLAEKLHFHQFTLALGIYNVHFTAVDILFSAAALGGVLFLAYAYKLPEKLGIMEPGDMERKKQEIMDYLSNRYQKICAGSLDF
jgi:hypothetical protein